MSLGFSLLIWVKPDSVLIENLEGISLKAMQDEILSDAQTLLGCKWGMDFTKITAGDFCCIHGNNLRFTAGTEAIKAALGQLWHHIDFIRSTPNMTPEDLIRYKECRDKWKVGQEDTESTSGTQDKAHQKTTSTSHRYKPY